VRTSYQDENGLRHETVTVRELVRRQLALLPESIEIGDRRSRACARREATRLRGAAR
jgi:Flp pilus assembly CpaF family ATPase